MAMGIIITGREHNQDIRYLRNGNTTLKIRTNILYISTILLVSLPILRGYFTKDLILERIGNARRWLIESILYRILLFRFYYSFKLFNFTCRNMAINSYKVYNKVNLTLTIFILMMLTVNLFIFQINL